MTEATTLGVTFRGAVINPLSKNTRVGFEAEGDIRRSDFGVKT